MNRHSPCTVLLVDAQAAATTELSCALQEKDMHVLCAAAGKAALDMLHSQKIDIIAITCELPGMDGQALLEQISEQFTDTARLLVVSSENTDAIQRALDTGTYDVLIGDMDAVDALVERIDKAYQSLSATRAKDAHVAELESRNLKLAAANKRLLQLNKQLRHLAITDSLTRLYNRRYIDDWMQNYSLSNQCTQSDYSVLLLDVDHFKSVNDSLGHDGGDQVLRHLASVLRNVKRDTDLVGRYGGEEFIVIMPGADNKAAMRVAERVRAMIEAAVIEVQHGNVSITASIGVSTYLSSATDTPASVDSLLSSRALIAQADKALYEAKAKGRNLCVHYRDLSDGQSSPTIAA